MSKKGYKKTKFHTGTVIYTKLIRFPPINPFNKRYSFFIKLNRQPDIRTIQYLAIGGEGKPE